MSRVDFFESIDSIIQDWNNTNFTTSASDDVPGLENPNLTYGDGEEKKGIEINTCVLFVDIRNSVALTQKHQMKTMGKIYSVFTQCILMAARFEGGFVRNIIGDRVMVVFPKDDCFTNAVNCAVTINHIAKKINKIFNTVEFKCGIGIDYGKMNVMKIGKKMIGDENDDNKGLVWVGYPANYASRLTDCANKEFNDTFYEVDANFYEYNYFGNPYFGRTPRWYRMVKKFTAEQLADSLKASLLGLTSTSFINAKSISRIVEPYTYSPILISDNVYQNFKKLNPNCNSIKKGLWKEETREIRDIKYVVWGSDLIWE